MLQHDPHVHLEGLEEVAVDVIADGFLRLGAGERDVALLEECRDVPAGYLAL